MGTRAAPTSPVSYAVQRLEDLVLVVDLAHVAFLLVEQDAVVGREPLVEVGAEVQRHGLQPHLSLHLRHSKHRFSIKSVK